MLRHARRGKPMDSSEADRMAILAALEAETDAYFRRDYAALASHWVQSPQSRLMIVFNSLGVRVDKGWDAIGARYRATMARAAAYDAAKRIHLEGVNVVVGGDMAWVSYEQVAPDTGDGIEVAGLQHELKIFHRVDGDWKIACLVLAQSTVELANWPLVEVDADLRIVWMNRQARQRLRDHPGLVDAGGTLRARRTEHRAALGDAVKAAYRELGMQFPLNVSPKQAWAVSLGDDDTGAPLHCWVLLEDARTLVSFDDAETVERRIAGAEEVYGLSPAQVRLARLIVNGHDLASAAERLDVSINTLRTQLQRIFDKTGVRTQAALVRALLSSDAPTK